MDRIVGAFEDVVASRGNDVVARRCIGGLDNVDDEVIAVTFRGTKGDCCCDGESSLTMVDGILVKAAEILGDTLVAAVTSIGDEVELPMLCCMEGC